MAAGEQCDVKVCTGVQWTQKRGGRDAVPDNTIPSTVFCWFHAQSVEVSPTVSASSTANKFPKPAGLYNPLLVGNTSRERVLIALLLSSGCFREG